MQKNRLLLLYWQLKPRKHRQKEQNKCQAIFVADNIINFLLFFIENKSSHFDFLLLISGENKAGLSMWTVSLADHSHKMSSPMEI